MKNVGFYDVLIIVGICAAIVFLMKWFLDVLLWIKKKQLQSESWEIRRNAAKSLGNSTLNGAFDLLIKTLSDRKDMVRIAAVEALGAHGDPRAVGPLINALKNEDDNYPVVGSLIDSLKSLDPNWRTSDLAKKAVKEAIFELQDPDVKVRRRAIKILERTADPEAVEPLIATLKDPDQDVFNDASWALAVKFRDRRAIAPLIVAYAKNEGEIRYRASLMLEKYNEFWDSCIEAKEAIPELLEIQADAEDSERQEFVKGLIDKIKVAQADIQAEEDLKKSKIEKVKAKLLSIGGHLRNLEIISENDALERLNTTNAERRRVWGNNAVLAPIIEGSQETVFQALFKCVTDDCLEYDFASLGIEEMRAPDSDKESARLERAREQMGPHLDQRYRDYYEKRLIKKMQKEKGKTKDIGSQRLQEIKVKVYYQNTFSTHRILRVAENSYMVLLCIKRD